MRPSIKSLKKGDTIGIIAPASPVSEEEIEPAVRLIEDEGYRVMYGDHLYDKKGYLAGIDEDRLADLHDMFLNDDVKAVLCARGGYGTPRLINKIDFNLIMEHPKPLTGYSDITALLLSIYFKTGMHVWHGPMLRGIAGREGYLKGLLSLISSDGAISYPLSLDNVLRKGTAKGRLMGGNLSMICTMIGTRYLPSFKEAIFFIEERGEPLYRIDRMLTQLRLSGLIKGVKGVIVGNFNECGDTDSIDALVLETFSSGCPIYRGFPAGHGERNHPLPIGADALLDTESLLFRVDAFMNQD